MLVLRCPIRNCLVWNYCYLFITWKQQKELSQISGSMSSWNIAAAGRSGMAALLDHWEVVCYWVGLLCVNLLSYFLDAEMYEWLIKGNPLHGA